MLFEFSDWQQLKTGQRSALDLFLQEAWKKRLFSYADYVSETNEAETAEDLENTGQPFLRFDGDFFRTQNYVGFIQLQGEVIEVYPKVFRHAGLHMSEMQMHLFYWLGYCNRLQFPVPETTNEAVPSTGLPEILTWYFARYTREVIAAQPFSRYETVEEQLQVPRGRIDFGAWVQHGLATGNHQHIDCVYEPFVYDNTLNRAIKYVVRLLLGITQIPVVRTCLEELIFLLDEVEDVTCTTADLDRLKLPDLYAGYNPVITWCRRFLEQQLYGAAAAADLQWSLLLPMEYVFEDFVAGFIVKHFSATYTVLLQGGTNVYLVKENAFRLYPDIYLQHKQTGEKIIIDTKYKMRYAGDAVSQGVAQSDMYQMLGYAYRHGCEKVILLYPNTEENPAPPVQFRYASAFAESRPVTVHIITLPFWSSAGTAALEMQLKKALGDVLG